MDGEKSNFKYANLISQFLFMVHTEVAEFKKSSPNKEGWILCVSSAIGNFSFKLSWIVNWTGRLTLWPFFVWDIRLWDVGHFFDMWTYSLRTGWITVAKLHISEKWVCCSTALVSFSMKGEIKFTLEIRFTPSRAFLVNWQTRNRTRL